MKRVEVTWADSAATNGWHGRDKTADVVKARSLGYLVERTKKRVVIAQSRTAYQLGEFLAIPTSAVVKVRKL